MESITTKNSLIGAFFKFLATFQWQKNGKTKWGSTFLHCIMVPFKLLSFAVSAQVSSSYYFNTSMMCNAIYTHCPAHMFMSHRVHINSESMGCSYTRARTHIHTHTHTHAHVQKEPYYAFTTTITKLHKQECRFVWWFVTANLIMLRHWVLNYIFEYMT